MPPLVLFLGELGEGGGTYVTMCTTAIKGREEGGKGGRQGDRNIDSHTKTQRKR